MLLKYTRNIFNSNLSKASDITSCTFQALLYKDELSTLFRLPLVIDLKLTSSNPELETSMPKI